MAIGFALKFLRIVVNNETRNQVSREEIIRIEFMIAFTKFNTDLSESKNIDFY